MDGYTRVMFIANTFLKILKSPTYFLANTGHEITYKRYIFAKYYNNSQNQQTSDNELTNRYQAN